MVMNSEPLIKQEGQVSVLNTNRFTRKPAGILVSFFQLTRREYVFLSCTIFGRYEPIHQPCGTISADTSMKYMG